MKGTRALVRLAARDARRDRWRTLLIVLMVALPVAGLVATVALVDTTTATAEERAVGRLGVAAAVISPGWSPQHAEIDAGEALAELEDRVPPGSRLEAVTRLDDRALAGERLLSVDVRDQRLDSDALAVGQVELLEGGPPRSADAVVVTSALAEVLGVGVGERFELEALGSVEVAGIARRLESLSVRQVFVEPGALAAGGSASQLDHVLLATPVDADGPLLTGGGVVVDDDWSAAGEDPDWILTTRGFVMAERYTSGERFAFVVAGGLAGVEVALIVGAAFAVSVRRRQRELGLLAAVGGSQQHVKRVVLLTGAVSALVGIVSGTALGILGLYAAGPWLDRFADRVVGGPTFDPVWLLTAAAIGMVAVLVGAWLPARAVARLPITTALSGRRPTPAPSRHGLVGGVVLVGVGVAVLVFATTIRQPYVFLLGCVLIVLGAGWTSPWLLERLGKLAPRLPVGMRLAVRDAARYRTRNGPIVTAAMAGLAASITVASLLGSMAAEVREARALAMADNHLVVEGGEHSAALVADHLAGELDAEQLLLNRPQADVTDAETGWYLNPVWGTPELARELGGDAAAEALADGRAVVLAGPAGITELAVRYYDHETGEPGSSQLVPAVVVPGQAPDGASWFELGDALLPPSLQDQLSPSDVAVDAAWVTHLLVLDGPVGRSDRAEAEAAVRTLAPDEAWVRTRDIDDRDALMRAIVTGIGVLSGLVIVTVAIALAAAESRSDLRILGAVGADRRTRRSLAVGRALLLAGLGGVLAVPVGLIPAYVIATYAGSSARPSPIPWITVAVVAIGVPAVAALGAAISSLRDPGPWIRAA